MDFLHSPPALSCHMKGDRAPLSVKNVCPHMSSTYRTLSSGAPDADPYINLAKIVRACFHDSLDVSIAFECTMRIHEEEDEEEMLFERTLTFHVSTDEVDGESWQSEFEDLDMDVTLSETYLKWTLTRTDGYEIHVGFTLQLLKELGLEEETLDWIACEAYNFLIL
eukprot:518550-Pleurochrysis_carterae.AAC.1